MKYTRKFVHYLWNPSLLLAVILQILPICRTVFTHPAVINSFAIILRWTIGGAAALEAYDSVSGATNNSGVYFTCPLVTTGTVSQAFDFHTTLGGPGLGADCCVAFGASGLPAGLSISNVDGKTTSQIYGDIYGLPTTATTSNVIISAIYSGCLGCSITTNLVITIVASSPAQVTGQPTPLTTIQSGGSATFSVTASGSPPVFYRWRKDAVTIPNATSSSLALTGVHTNQAGLYSAIVSNASGIATSSNALLIVNVPPPPPITLPAQPPNLFLFSFSPVIGLTNSVVTNNVMVPGPWNVLTNIPPPASANSIIVTDTFNGVSRYYRVQFSP
jgi:hypothetical protein